DTKYMLYTMPTRPSYNSNYYTLEFGESVKVDDEWVIEWDLVIRSDMSIDHFYTLKIDELNVACQTTILTSGFHSNALGTTHFYTSDAFDQANIQGNVLDVVAGAEEVHHYCYDQEGVRDYRPHTKEQMIQVGRDLKASVTFNLAKCSTLKTAAKTALDANDVSTLVAIVWE